MVRYNYFCREANAKVMRYKVGQMGEAGSRDGDLARRSICNMLEMS